MKNIKVILIVSLFFLFSKSYSQSNFTSGYIVNIKGDTTYGFIKKQSGSKNCKQVVFKENESPERTIFEAKDIKSYFMNTGQLYLSGEIIYRNIDIEADRIIAESKDNLSEENAEYITATVFLNVLFLGEASLYSYIDEKSHPHFFIKKKDDKMYELYQLRKYGTLNYDGLERDAYRIEKNYIGTLRNLFRDCPEMMAKIDKTELNSKDLIQIIKDYNLCKFPEMKEFEVYSSPGEIMLEKSFTFGINFSEYHFTSTSPYYNYLTKADPSKSQHFNFGFNINLYNPGYSKKFSLRSGLTYFKIKYDYWYSEVPSLNLTNTYDVHLENQYLKFPVMLNYDLSNAVFKPYVFIGTQFNFVLKSFSHMTVHRETAAGSIVIEKRPAISPPATIGQGKSTWDYELLGLSFGGGIKHLKEKKFGYFFDITYDRITSTSRIRNLYSASESLFITFGFIF